MAKDTLRSGQVITTFGPGSLLDLPDSSVILGGLEHWNYDRKDIPTIKEDRLLRMLQNQENLSPKPQALRSPPKEEQNAMPGTFEPNVTAWEFPELSLIHI